MSEYQLTQTKERIAALLAEINEKTDEVERLVKEEKCLVKEEKCIVEEEKLIVKEDNTSMQDILAKIICAEENYKAAQMTYTKTSETVEAALKVYNEQRDVIDVSIAALRKTETEDEMEANKAFYAAEKEAIRIFRAWEDYHTRLKRECAGMQAKCINETNETNKKCYKDIIELLLVFNKTEAEMIKETGSSAPDKNSPSVAMNYVTININKIKKYNIFYQERQLSYNTMWDNFNKSEASISLTTARTEQTKAKNLMVDPLQKYETEKLNFFKAHLTDTLSDIEWKRSNFEMVDNMLKQITVLQACEEKRAEEKRAEEKRAEEKRAEEKLAEEKQAEEKHSEEKRAEENRKNFEKVEIMLKQIEVLQNWMNETKIREEKRANAIEAFLEERHKF